MSTYLIYNSSSGTINRALTISADSETETAILNSNLATGESQIAVPDTHPALVNQSAYVIVNNTVQEVVLSAAQQLSIAQKNQLALLEISYEAAMTAPVSYMGTQIPNDNKTQRLLSRAVQAFTLSGSVPTNFFIFDINNNKVSMTLADLTGLVSAVSTQEWAATQQWANVQQQIMAATTIAEVQAVVW